MSDKAALSVAREAFHARLLRDLLHVDKDGVPGNADKSQSSSVSIAKGILERIGGGRVADRAVAQSSGKKFEELVSDFVAEAFGLFEHLRPGEWAVEVVKSRSALAISRFQQYQHLRDLAQLSEVTPALAAVLGNSYVIAPDVVVFRQPLDDEAINRPGVLVDQSVARQTGVRRVNKTSPILHANISCKWTLRSDRAQNARSEALSLIRSRKGALPQIAVVTGEPLPSRIASLALGTGDIDCVYHIALPELVAAVQDLRNDEAESLLATMRDGERIRDIADLPLDLVV